MTMTLKELDVLHEYIDSSTHYLEFGSGESTIYASKSTNLKTINSVESSINYINENLINNPVIASALSSNKLCFHIVDIGETVTWGYPKDKTKKHLWPNYALSVFSQSKNYDLVLVDGRFRVACILNYLLNTPKSSTLIIHDFWNRSEYHNLLKYLHLKKRVDSLGVFGKAENINTSKIQSLIKKYQYLPNDKTLIFRLKSKLKKSFIKSRQQTVVF
jgi:hypothetical protein